MTEPISLDTTQPPVQNQISLDPGEQSTTLSPEVATSRARKIEFGLGPVTGIDKPTAEQTINAGHEMDLRRAAAAQIDIQKSDQKRALISQMVKENSGSISQDQLKFVNDKFTMASMMGQEPPTNPQSVMEEYYAGQYLKPMYDVSDQFHQGSFMPEAIKEVPEHVDSLRNVARGLTESREMINTRLEDAKARLHNQSYFGYGVDFAKTMVPGYTEAKVRDNLDINLRGTNLMNQARQLYAMPPEERKAYFNARMDKLEHDNPQVAVEYAEAMLGYTTSQENLNNLFTAIDVSSLPLAGVAKGILSGGKAAIRSAASATGLTEALAKQATTATKDIVASQATEGVPLRVLQNQHFGEESARLNYELAQARKDHSFNASVEGKFANEGLRAQYTSRVATRIADLDIQLKDLKAWHADNAINGPDASVLVQQPVKDPAVAAAAGRGDLATAGVETAAKEVAETASGKANPELNTIQALTSSLRTDTQAFIENPGRDGQEIANRVMEQNNKFTADIEKAAGNIQRVQRTPNIKIKEAVEALKNFQKDFYPGIRNAILNVSDPILNRDLNTYSQKMFFGRTTAEYFASKTEAEGFAHDYGLIGETVEQKGLGWYVSIEKPIDETSHPIRDWILKTKESETPGGWLNAFVGWLRTPEDTLSFEQNLQRKLATYNVGPFMNFAKETVKDIRNLGGLKGLKNFYSNFRDWEQVVASARDKMDEELSEKMGRPMQGYFFKTGQELDDEYLRVFNRFPSGTEKSAYFAFKRVVEYDRILRAMSLYRNKMRLGTEQHALSILDTDGKTLIKSPFFDGVQRKELPGGDHNILILGNREGDERMFKANNIAPKLAEKLKEEILKGERKVVEIFDPAKTPLNGWGNINNARIRYVVTNRLESKPISVMDQVPRRGGGHFEYDYDNYIKQANVQFDEASQTHWYNGDTTLMPVSLRGMGYKAVERLNAVRELIKADKIDEAKALATSKDGVPGIPWDEHLGWYQNSKDAQGRFVPARLSKNEPLRVVPQGKAIGQMDNEMKLRYFDKEKGIDFQDGTSQGSLARSNQVQYTQERDSEQMHALSDVGSKNNPIFKYEPAKLVSPITTMNRTLSRIVNSTFMDDYKIFSVESWVQQAKHWLDMRGRDPTDVERSPFFYFNHPNWLPGTPEDIKAQLMNIKFKTDQLVGIPSKVDTFLHSAAQALADSVYKLGGPKALPLDPSWLLPKLRDPFRFMRSIVFNEKMGLFSVPQFLVHAMTYANVMGIAGPKNASAGAIGALMHGYASVNSSPEIIEQLSRLAEKMGWAPGAMKEAYDTVQRTGFMNVAGEHAFMDAPMANRVIQNGGTTFLDAGQIFFHGGVKSLRAGSWYTAFKEFRDLHPTGAITDDDLKRILSRADLLSHNMTRASASSLTTGIMSVPAQFYTYQLRLFEMMMPFAGGRLTTLEKTRLFGVNAALFGIPVATGIYGNVFSDNLRKFAQDNNYVVGDKFLQSLAMEGGLSSLGALVSGNGDISKGNFYNVGDRYGAKFPIEETLDGDKTIWQLFGGASLQSLSNTWAQSSGLRAVGMGLITGHIEALGELTPEDGIGPLKEITSVNSVNHIIAATRYGNWMSKNNAVLHPASLGNAIFEAATGLSEQRDTDMWTMSQTLKANKEFDNHLFGMFQNRFSLAVQSSNNNDIEQSKAYMKEALAILHQGGYPEDKIPEAVAAAMRAANEGLVDRTKFNFYIKNTHNQQPEAYEAERRIQAARGEK